MSLPILHNSYDQFVDATVDSHVRGLLSGTAPVSYDNTTGAISMHVADATHDGYLSDTDWSAFNAKQAALTIGNFSETTSSVLTITGGTGAIIGSGLTVGVKQASGSVSGYLSSTDWTTFNGKQNAITPAALTKSDDTNVTLTLGGTPASSLLAATSLTLGWSGQLSLARGGTGVNLTDPNANKILAWDDTDNSIGFWTLGTNLSYDHSAHTLNATGGGGGGGSQTPWTSTIDSAGYTLTGASGDNVLNMNDYGDVSITVGSGHVLHIPSPVTLDDVLTLQGGVLDGSGQNDLYLTASVNLTLTAGNSGVMSFQFDGVGGSVQIDNKDGSGYVEVISDGAHSLVGMTSITTRGGWIIDLS